MISEHDIIRPRHAHDVSDPCRSKARQQRIHVILIRFRMVGVANINPHRQAKQLAAEMIFQPRTQNLLAIKQIFWTNEAHH